MSEKSTGKTVSFTIDLDNPPPLTAEELSQIERLKTMRDEDIDFSDIPEQRGLASWNRPGLFGGPVGKLRLAALKEKVLMLDEDVVELLKKAGDATPERMNAILREYAETRVSSGQTVSR
jgi:uncharacterized protein (DUF4415 family)